MSKPKTKSAVPHFATEAQERAYWESTDSSQHLDWTKAKKATLPNLRPTSTTPSRTYLSTRSMISKWLLTSRDVHEISDLKFVTRYL